jgi:hypothetical protein
MKIMLAGEAALGDVGAGHSTIHPCDLDVACGLHIVCKLTQGSHMALF